MEQAFKYILVLSFYAQSFKGQVNSLEIDTATERMYNPYMLWRHSGPEGLAEFKIQDRHNYLKELWYYSRSFYIKRNYFSSGVMLSEANIDVSRYELKRNEEEEVIVVLEGFKDVMVLLPANKLIYKP